MSVWTRIKLRIRSSIKLPKVNAVAIAAVFGGVCITLALGLLAVMSIPAPKDSQLLALPGGQAGGPGDHLRMVLSLLMFLVAMTANDGFAFLEAAWLAALLHRLPACMGWLLPTPDVILAFPYIQTALECWMAFFLLRHGERFIYAAVALLSWFICFVPGVGPVVQRWHNKVFSVRRASEQPPSDSE